MSLMAILGLVWSSGGLLSFLFNLKNIIKFAEDFFIVGETTYKVIYYVAAFLIHVIGGFISAGVTVYSYFHKKG